MLERPRLARVPGGRLLGRCAVACLAAPRRPQAARAGRTRCDPRRGRPPTSTASAPRSRPPSNAWFTLRQGSLSEVYYPDLSTPGFRGLQFAVSDGKGLLQRETVDDDPRTSSRSRPA